MTEIPKLQSVKPYISKRKRKNNANCGTVESKRQNLSLPIFDSKIFLAKEEVYKCSLNFSGNTNPRKLLKSVNVSGLSPLWSCKWNQKHSHLVACTSGKSLKLIDCFDEFIPVWLSQDAEEQVKDLSWSRTCKQIVSCDFGKSVKMWDFIRDGVLSTSFRVPEIPSVIRWWPDDDNMVIVGGRNSFLASYDLRSSKLVTNFDVEFGDILNLDVIPGTGYFVTSTDAVSRQSARDSLSVWDFSTGAKISGQVFHEKFTCPSMCVHPSGTTFLAQTNGSYVARFSAKHPYRLDRYVRYETHNVEGYPIGMDISRDGRIVVSGSCDGALHFYRYTDATRMKVIQVPSGNKKLCERPNALITVQYHPVLSSMVAAGDWSGNLHIFK